MRPLTLCKGKRPISLTHAPPCARTRPFPARLPSQRGATLSEPEFVEVVLCQTKSVLDDEAYRDVLVCQ